VTIEKTCTENKIQRIEMLHNQYYQSTIKTETEIKWRQKIPINWTGSLLQSTVSRFIKSTVSSLNELLFASSRSLLTSTFR